MSTTAGVPPRGLPQDPAASPARRPGRRIVLITIGIVALVVAALWLARWWTVGRFIESTDDAYLRADSVTVAPKVSGYVTEVFVGDNQAVKAGDPLVRLDTRQYQAALEQAQATIDARAADIQRAQADIQQQHANIAQAKAQRQVARVSAQHARDEVQRYAPLVATGAETRERLAELTSTRDPGARDARGELGGARRRADADRRDHGADRPGPRATRGGACERTPGPSRSARTRSCAAHSPAGVGDRSVRVGQYVQPGTRMLTVVPVQDTYIDANFKETQVGHMRVGQPVTLHIDALPGQALHGVVDSFAPGTGSEFALLPPENATGNFTKIVQRVPVRIRIETGPQTRAVLLPGLSVTVEVDTRSARELDKRIEAENTRG
ncbi:MAG: HlyD family secretion protein [Pararobbsia sp.]